MEKEWDPIYFEIKDYKNTGTYILKASEETSQLLDDHIVMTQSMSFSPYKKPFEDRISNWENKLKTTQVCFIFYSLKTQNKLMGWNFTIGFYDKQMCL